MNQLFGELEIAGAAEAFNRMGLDASAMFHGEPGIYFNPYRSHEWLVKENDDFLVVNAIPPVMLQDHLFWEEWYIQRSVNEIHHHVLSLWRPKSFDEIFRAPEHDDIHPEYCFGRSWYVIDDPDMSPWLLRRS